MTKLPQSATSSVCQVCRVFLKYAKANQPVDFTCHISRRADIMEQRQASINDQADTNY